MLAEVPLCCNLSDFAVSSCHFWVFGILIHDYEKEYLFVVGLKTEFDMYVRVIIIIVGL